MTLTLDDALGLWRGALTKIHCPFGRSFRGVHFDQHNWLASRGSPNCLADAADSLPNLGNVQFVFAGRGPGKARL